MVIDIVVALILIFNTFSGIRKGLILSITSFLGVILSGILALNYLDDFYFRLISLTDTKYTANATPYVESFYNSIHQNQFAYILAFVILVLFFYFVIYILGLTIKLFFKLILLDWLDRLGGAFFGLAKGSIISIVFLFLFSISSKYNSNLERSLNESYSYQYMPYVSQTVWNVLPGNTQIKIREYLSNKNFESLLDNFLLQEDISLNKEI